MSGDAMSATGGAMSLFVASISASSTTGGSPPELLSSQAAKREAAATRAAQAMGWRKRPAVRFI
jgi:hypothetical protein